MAYFGMIFGLNSFARNIKNQFYCRYNEPNYYYQNTKNKWYIKYGLKLIYLLLFFIPLSAFYLVPNNININILYIIGPSIPMLIFGFLLFGPYFIFNILFNISNIILYIPELGKEGLLIF